MLKRSSTLLLASLLALSAAAPVGAAPIGPAEIDINGAAVNLAELGCAPVGGTDASACSGHMLYADDYSWTLQNWSIALDPDPTVNLFFAIQNNSAAVQSFEFSVLLPIVPAGPQVSITGSVAGSVTDVNQNGATLSDDGSPLYTASIDGTSVQTLLDPPQSFVAAAFGSATIGPAAFGPTPLGQSANSDIGIKIRFTLTPGDIASFTSVFDVLAIPEPGTLLLLGSGLAGLVASGRRS